MSYKIALASSDGSNIDESFGAAKYFLIYEVSENGYKKVEERAAVAPQMTSEKNEASEADNEFALGNGVFNAVELSENGLSVDNDAPIGNNALNNTLSGCGKTLECGVAYGCGATSGTGAFSGCGSGSGCGGGQAVSEKVALISDCRCVVCKKIGFNVQKQLERKAISAFDVNCSVDEALERISFYFSRIDKHQSLRGLRSGT